MKTDNPIPSTIDDYLAGFPKDIRQKLEELRMTIRNAAPDAIEKISYRMPAFYLDGYLVYFAAFKNHIGFYAMPSGHKEFEKELSIYKQGKGSVQFPINESLPLDLITRIVQFRVNENRLKAATGKARKLY
jgi:uncharacterized protein YdhG (YjbR/CyaY superfamily)